MKQLLSLCLLLGSLTAFGQGSKTVIVTPSPRTVPAGKVWKLQCNRPTKVQLHEGTLRSGTMCNGLFLSRPGLVFNVNKGYVPNAVSYGIVFKSFEKVPYTNEYTYTISPVAIVDKNFSLDELNEKKAEDVGVKEIVFRAGEVVFVATCVASIELTEYNMSATELAAAQKKSSAMAAAKKAVASNLTIPVNPEKYVAPGTKPVIHDKDFKTLNLKSTGVLHQRPGKPMALDDAAVFNFSLSADAVDIESQSGINKSYKVLGVKYNEEMKMQEFKLGDEAGSATHKLLVAWSNSSNGYMLLLNSVDKSEEYQFQETELVSKQ
jgi:hypothetical protein